jgi:predicted CopG family antitoxin
MTTRFTITVPDDVADRLRSLPEGRRSGYISDAVREAARRERQQQALAELYARHGQPSPDQTAAAEAFLDQVNAFQQAHSGGRPAA